jgi:hypothetical protein
MKTPKCLLLNPLEPPEKKYAEVHVENIVELCPWSEVEIGEI